MSDRPHSRGADPRDAGDPRDSVGMRKGVEITVVPSHPLWPAEFARVRREVDAVLGSLALAIDHVGSTSVPGLAAKPILDVLVTVERFDVEPATIADLERLGFRYRTDDELPDRHYLPRDIGGLRCHHLSLAVPGSWHREATLAFRDALRGDPELARSYGALKVQLADRVGSRRLAYLNGKTSFVLDVLSRRGFVPPDGYPLHFG